MRIIVEVLVPSYFMGAPRFPDLDVENALVVFNDRGSNFSEREGPTTWAGQSRSYTVYPQLPGSYDVGVIGVEVAYFAGGRAESTARNLAA